MTPLEEQFNREMKSVYILAKSECGYNATYFLKMLSELGGVKTAKKLLRSSNVQGGFAELLQCGRKDITMEARVIKPDYVSLFTEEEINIATERLLQYN